MKISSFFVLMKTESLALMEATSFCAGVRHKRYSAQQERAPDFNYSCLNF